MKKGFKGFRAQWFVLLALVALLASGCAACRVKPDETAAPAAAAAPAVAETMPVTEQAMGPGYGVAAVDESAAADQAAAAAAQVATLERIHFGFDRFDLSAEAQAILANNATWIKANPAAKVQIEGHCDERGSDEYNLALGERRALAAKNYLVSLGVPADRLSVISYGEERPLDPARTEAAYALNRRAEFVTR